MRPGLEHVRDQRDGYLIGDQTYSAQLAVYWTGELDLDERVVHYWPEFGPSSDPSRHWTR